jgi:hypothetical protein
VVAAAPPHIWAKPAGQSCQKPSNPPNLASPNVPKLSFFDRFIVNHLKSACFISFHAENSFELARIPALEREKSAL